jgi:RNA polymerase sigma-70 factor (ECF subfamily)
MQVWQAGGSARVILATTGRVGLPTRGAVSWHSAWLAAAGAGIAVALEQGMTALSAPMARTSRTSPGRAATTEAARAPRTMNRPVSRPDRDFCASFEAQCLPHQRELYAVALRMTRVPADAHDLVQETMLRAFAAWSGFEAGSNCRAWLFRILTNSYINLYRKRHRHHRIARARPDDTLTAAHPEDGVHARSPEDTLLYGSFGDEVTAALATLGDDYRAVVEMADLQGICYREIAAALGVPIGTVMSRLFRARRQLEGELSAFAAADYGIRRAA